MALAAARLGGTVYFHGCLGTDDLADRLERHLTAYGVHCCFNRKPSPTGRSINLCWDTKQRHFISFLPNNRLLSESDIDMELLSETGCKHLFRTDIWFSESMLRHGNRVIFQKARTSEMVTSLDINWDPEWSKYGTEGYSHERKKLALHVLPLVNWVHGNEVELKRFTGMEDIKDVCHFLLDQGAGGVVIHRGERGAAGITPKDGWIDVPAAPIQRAVCPTGSGDVFGAAFMLLPNLPLKKRLGYCCRIASAYLQGDLNLIPRM